MEIPQTKEQMKKNHDHLVNELANETIDQIENAFNSKSSISFIILFGSRARGDYNWFSDFDLLICGDSFIDVRYLDRSDFLTQVQFSGALEVICYTFEEAWNALNQGSLTMLECLEEGIVLKNYDERLQLLKERFNMLLKTNLIQKIKNDPYSKWRIN
jgi:predicted nucleotidyltransferase